MLFAMLAPQVAGAPLLSVSFASDRRQKSALTHRKPSPNLPATLDRSRAASQSTNRDRVAGLASGAHAFKALAFLRAAERLVGMDAGKVARRLSAANGTAHKDVRRTVQSL